MVASRVMQNIFYSLKNKNYKRVWYLIKKFDRLTYEDTFMPIFCKIKGHKPYQPDKVNDPDEWACKRCHRYINYNLKLQRKLKLKKIKKYKKWWII